MKQGLHPFKHGKRIVLDMSEVLGPTRIALEPKDLNRVFPVIDTGHHGKRIGELTISQFLEKYG